MSMKKTVPALFTIVFLLLSCNADPMDIETEPQYWTITYHSEGHTSGEPPVDIKRYVVPRMHSWPSRWIVMPETSVIMEQGTLEREGVRIQGLDTEGRLSGDYTFSAGA